MSETRAQLVATARDLYLETGPAHFSLREVARRVGISPAAVYRHFDGKEPLLEAACMQGFQIFSSYLVRALSETTPMARMLATGDQYRLFGLENPTDYRFIFMSPPTMADSTTYPRETTFRMLVDRVRECMDAGDLARDDAERTAVQIWAHVHGLVSLRLAGHLRSGTDAEFAELYRHSMVRLLAGLAA